tara:strand:+ start:489 stop:728 length:240 start_codon:yes stop_codon:yes gene_type:complete
MANSDYAIVFQSNLPEYPGGVSVCHPTDITDETVEEIAKKVVPTGKPYKIIPSSEVPTDRSFRNAWTVEDSELTDGVGD